MIALASMRLLPYSLAGLFPVKTNLVPSLFFARGKEAGHEIKIHHTSNSITITIIHHYYYIVVLCRYIP